MGGWCLEGKNQPKVQESQCDISLNSELFCSERTNKMKGIWTDILLIWPDPQIFVGRNMMSFKPFLNDMYQLQRCLVLEEVTFLGTIIKITFLQFTKTGREPGWMWKQLKYFTSFLKEHWMEGSHWLCRQTLSQRRTWRPFSHRKASEHIVCGTRIHQAASWCPAGQHLHFASIEL